MPPATDSTNTDSLSLGQKRFRGRIFLTSTKFCFRSIWVGNMHWIAAVIFIKRKRIEIFDSMGADGHHYLNALFRYVQDEHKDKKKCPLPDVDEWELVPTQRDTPRQRNGTFSLLLLFYSYFFPSVAFFLRRSLTITIIAFNAHTHFLVIL